MVSAAGSAQWRGAYEAFGAAHIDPDPDGDLQTATLYVRLPGQYLDTESDTHGNRYRTYSSEGGRYLSVDPIGKTAGSSLYHYARSNPIRYVDPLGLVTVILTVRDFGIGAHSAVYGDAGPNNEPFLYDPAGSYVPPNGEPRGSGDMYVGRSADLDAYRAFHEANGSTVEMITLPTTPQEEAAIAARAEAQGGAAPFTCTAAVSSAVGGVCGLRSYWLPDSLSKAARRARDENQCKGRTK